MVVSTDFLLTSFVLLGFIYLHSDALRSLLPNVSLEWSSNCKGASNANFSKRVLSSLDGTLSHDMCDSEPSMPEIHIAVMGTTGSGKSTFINLVSGADFDVGMSLTSCTAIVAEASSFQLDGRLITLIDTPGFDDSTKSDTEILKMIAQFLAASYKRGVKLAGIIYMHRISDFRMGGIAKRNFSMFRNLCGEDTLRNVAVVTNMWNTISLEDAEAREAELRDSPLFFKPVLDKHARLFRHDNTVLSALNILYSLMDQTPEALLIQQELVDDLVDIDHTDAVKTLNRDLMERDEKHLREKRFREQQMQDKIREQEEEKRKAHEKQVRRLKEEMDRTEAEGCERERMAQQEQERLEMRMRQLEGKAQREAEMAADLHGQQMEAVREEFHRNLAAQRAAADREMQVMQTRQKKSDCCIQ